MKFLVLMKQREVPPVLPPNQVMGLLQAAKAWHKADLEAGSSDFVYSVIPNGERIMGVAISNGKSHEEILQRLYSYPLFALYDWAVYPLAELNPAVDAAIDLFKRMAG